MLPFYVTRETFLETWTSGKNLSRHVNKTFIPDVLLLQWSPWTLVVGPFVSLFYQNLLPIKNETFLTYFLFGARLAKCVATSRFCAF